MQLYCRKLYRNFLKFHSGSIAELYILVLKRNFLSCKYEAHIINHTETISSVDFSISGYSMCVLEAYEKVNKHPTNCFWSC